MGQDGRPVPSFCCLMQLHGLLGELADTSSFCLSSKAGLRAV